jgi:hypothetical protein
MGSRSEGVPGDAPSLHSRSSEFTCLETLATGALELALNSLVPQSSFVDSSMRRIDMDLCDSSIPAFGDGFLQCGEAT